MEASFVETTEELALPTIPLRDTVVFPHMMVPVIVDRERSIRALELALATPVKRLFLITQGDVENESPQREDFRGMGVVARVVQDLKLPAGHVKVLVEGEQRARLKQLDERDGATLGKIEAVTVKCQESERLRQLTAEVLSAFERYARLSQHVAFEGLMSILELDNPDHLADTLAAHLIVPVPAKQALLDILNPRHRLQQLLRLVEVEIQSQESR